MENIIIENPDGTQCAVIEQNSTLCQVLQEPGIEFGIRGRLFGERGGGLGELGIFSALELDCHRNGKAKEYSNLRVFQEAMRINIVAPEKLEGGQKIVPAIFRPLRITLEAVTGKRFSGNESYYAPRMQPGGEYLRAQRLKPGRLIEIIPREVETRELHEALEDVDFCRQYFSAMLDVYSKMKNVDSLTKKELGYLEDFFIAMNENCPREPVMVSGGPYEPRIRPSY